MQINYKSLISLFLTIIMIISLIPTTVFATEAHKVICYVYYSDGTQVTSVETQMNTSYFDLQSLSDSITAAYGNVQNIYKQYNKETNIFSEEINVKNYLIEEDTNFYYVIENNNSSTEKYTLKIYYDNIFAIIETYKTYNLQSKIAEIEEKGYDVLGVYTDKNFTNKITGNLDNIDISKYPNIYLKVKEIDITFKNTYDNTISTGTVNYLSTWNLDTIKEKINNYYMNAANYEFKYYQDSNYETELTLNYIHNCNNNIPVYVTMTPKQDLSKYKVLCDGNFPTTNTNSLSKGYICTAGTQITLEDVECEGYIFLGWYTDPVSGTKVENPYTITKDITLYAHWKVDPESSITTPTTYTIKLNGNLPSDAGSATIKGNISGSTGVSVDLGECTSDNYNFLGWYTSANGGTKVNSPYTITEDITLYAHWEAKESSTNKTYTITYNSNFPSNSNGHKESPSSATGTTAPTKILVALVTI